MNTVPMRQKQSLLTTSLMTVIKKINNLNKHPPIKQFFLKFNTPLW